MDNRNQSVSTLRLMLTLGIALIVMLGSWLAALSAAFWLWHAITLSSTWGRRRALHKGA